MLKIYNKFYFNIIFVSIICLALTTTSIPVSGNQIKNYDLNYELLDNQIDDASFDLEIRKVMMLGHIPSLSACIVKDNEIVWSKGYGMYNRRLLKPANDHTIYMTASLSKPVTATALMQLYDQGLFDLDDDINDYLPFTLQNPKYPDVPITFRMLLSHRSSFTCNLLSSEDFSEKIIWKHFLYLGHLKDILQSFYPNELYPWLKDVMVPEGSLYDSDYWGDFPPGTHSNYSGINFILIGYLVELLSNKPFAEYCMDNIFIPLGMYDTSFSISDLDESRLAVPYLWLMGLYIPAPHYEYCCYNPAAGLRTTVEDLSHFLNAHLNDGLYDGIRILNESTVEEMHNIQYPGVGYGLGFEIMYLGSDKYVGHWGRNVGFIAHMLGCPSSNLGIIYFYNEYSPNSPLLFGDYLGFTPKEAEARNIIPQMLLEKAEELVRI